jgi:xylulokinase
MPLVLGVGSSVHSTRVEVRDADSGQLFGSGRAEHPQVAEPFHEQDPAVWWNGLVDARRDAGGALGISTIAVAAQTDGLVVLDSEGRVIRPAKLRSDPDAAADAAGLVDALGVAEWVHSCGSVPRASSAIAKLAWLRRMEPDAFARVARVVSPHEWLNFRLSKKTVTDRGDASTTGYYSSRDDQWRTDLLSLVDDQREWSRCLPRVLEPGEAAGDRDGVVIAVGTGDHMAAALGLALRPRDLVLSLDSMCMFTVRERPTEDPSGDVSGLADATGQFLPLVHTEDVAELLATFAGVLGVDQNGFDRLALDAPPGAMGISLTPPRAMASRDAPERARSLVGISTDVSPELVARAAVEGAVHGLLARMDALRHADVPVGGRLVLLGTRSHALPQVLADLAARPVAIPQGDRVVAGACVQAASTFHGVPADDVATAWRLDRLREIDPDPDCDAEDLRARYRRATGRAEDR